MPSRRFAPRSLLVLIAAVLGAASCGGGGEELALGGQATVSHVVDPSKAGAAPAKLGITVRGLRKGTAAELEEGGFSLDPDEKAATPYYLDLVVENQDPAALVPQVSVSIEDGDANSVGPTAIIDLGGKPFAPCTPLDPDRKVEPGASIEWCRLYLVPPGFEIERAAFLPSQPGVETEFVYWKLS